MRVKSIRLLLFLFLSWPVLAQEGTFYITDYSPDLPDEDLIYDIFQDEDGFIWGAHRQGIVRFDGLNWEIFPTPGAVFKIIPLGRDKVIAGGRHGLGVLEQDESLNWHFQTITDTLPNSGDIFELAILDNNLLALNKFKVMSFDLTSLTLTDQAWDGNAGALTGLNILQGHVLINTTSSGVLTYRGGRLTPWGRRGWDQDEIVFTGYWKEKDRHIFGNPAGEVFYQEDGLIKTIKINDDEYLAKTEVAHGLVLGNNRLVLGTFRGGVVFIDLKTGNIDQIINYQTGLPDNEVLAMIRDKDEGVWVVHEFGLSRISPNLPFRSFGHFPGIEGHLLTVLPSGSNLYVGTTTGLYNLEEVRDYEEVVRLVRRKQPTTEAPKSGLFNLKKNQGRKGFLGFLKKEDSGDQYTTARVAEKELQAIRYIFKPMEGISSKINVLMYAGREVIAGGADGLFAIEGNETQLIAPEPVRFVRYDPSKKWLLSATQSGDFHTYVKSGGTWKRTPHFTGFTGYVTDAFFDSSGHLWLCLIDEILRLEIKGNEVLEAGEFPIENPFLHDILGAEEGGDVVFYSHSGKMIYDPKAHTLNLLKAEKRLDQYFLSSSGEVWYRIDETWHSSGGHIDVAGLNVLRLFNDISFVVKNRSNNDFWVIENRSRLYRKPGNLSLTGYTGYDLMLKEIRNPEQKILPRYKLLVEESMSNLTFEFIQPDFSGKMGVKYRYRLEGLQKEWSEWSPQKNSVAFTFLPPGDYALHAETLNVLGDVKSLEPIVFEVLPPYWKRPWFFALEFIVFAGLLMLSFRVRTLGDRYGWISRFLAFLTIIMVIEFIQAVAEAEFGFDTPVSNFAIQVVIAMMLLPGELLLRKILVYGQNPVKKKKKS